MAGNEIEFFSSALLGFLYLIPLIMYITSSLGLYKLAKNFGEKYPWMAFIPWFKLYTYIKTAGYSFGRGIVLLIINIIGAFLFLLFLIIVFYIFTKPRGITVSEAGMYLFIFIILCKILFQNIVMFFLYYGISKRAGQSKITAALMTLFPWCMLLIVARRTPDMSAEVQTSSSVADASDISIEL